jgi:hypothetical protein
MPGVQDYEMVQPISWYGAGSRVRRTDWRRLSTTRDGDAANAYFEISHPFRPLKGQEFKLVTYRHNSSEDRAYFHDAEGHWSSGSCRVDNPAA